MMTWTISSLANQKNKLRSNDKASNDLVKIIKEQNERIDILNEALDYKKEEVQALYAEVKRFKNIDESHQKLVGKLYLEINKLKKDAEEILLHP